MGGTNMQYDEGTFGGGFLLGFILGLVGVIIAIAINKAKTKKGALTGWLVPRIIEFIVVGAILVEKGII